MKKGNYAGGIILILIGVLFLLGNLDLVKMDFNYLWPLFLLVPGLLFEIKFFSNRKDPGVLVLAGILMTYGILFYVNIIYGWHLMDKLWPLFPLGVAFGLFQLFIFGNREKALLIPIGILGFFPLIALLNNLYDVGYSIVFAIILICIGIWIMVKKK